jgi:hypothetical protein
MKNGFISILITAIFITMIILTLQNIWHSKETVLWFWGSILLSPLLGVLSYIRFGPVKRNGIYIVLFSILFFIEPLVIEFVRNYNPVTTRPVIDITQFLSSLPFLILSLTTGLLFSQGLLIKLLFHNHSK